MSTEVEVYGCFNCPFHDRAWHRYCKIGGHKEVLIRFRNLRPGNKPPPNCPLRLGSVRHVLCDPDHPESKLFGPAKEIAP